MKTKMNYSRIEGAVDVELLHNSHIIIVGAGGSYCLSESLARSGVGKLSVLDYDVVGWENLPRQGYLPSQVGMKKVDALGEHLKTVNPGINYQGFTKNFLDMNEEELDSIFGQGDLFLFLTDSFKAQSFGNILALKYGRPAIWAGYYEKSRCAEIVFSIPDKTPACFRCCVSPRYVAQRENKNEIKISSSCNTIFHSQLLDSLVGMLSLAILHNNVVGYEYSNWFGEKGEKWERNLIQIKVHPEYGTQPNSLFERTFAPTYGQAFLFNAIWQTIEAERPPKYEHCPDCKGDGPTRQ